MLLAVAGFAAAVFYLSLVAICTGAALGARGAVEGRAPGRVALALLGFGALGSLVAIGSYVRGPRDVLPF